MPRFLTAIFFALCLCSCSRVEQARQVLHEADSLRAEGRLYPDSAVMAQTVKTLTPLRWAYPTQYATANYYYGKILRKNGDYVGATRYFLNVIGSSANNFQIEGRAYCNMGIFCQNVGNYELAYQLYRHSYNSFEKDNDSIAMLYARDDIAFACAKLHRKEECLDTLQAVANNCKDRNILAHSTLFKAILYRNLDQYDSALLFADKYLQDVPNASSAVLIKAQAFSYLDAKDSAVYYAKQVVELNSSEEDMGNAMYILQHDDAENISKDSVNIIAANRNDIQTELDIKHRKLSQAVLLIEQAMNRKPDYKLFASLFILMVVAIVALFVYLKHRRNKLKLDEDAETLKAEKDLYHKELSDKLEDICLSFRNSNNVLNALKWNDYTLLTETINMHFYRLADKLVQEKQLNEKEVRLCVLVLIGGFSSKQMAELLNYGENGIRNYKSKIAKKIGTDSKNMREKLLKIIINSECD